MSTPHRIEVRPDGALVSEGKLIARPGPEHAITMAIQLITASVTQSLINPVPTEQSDTEEPSHAQLD